MTQRVKLLYLSSTEWGNLGRRKVRLAHEFAQLDEVASVLFVNPPVETSLLDLIRGDFLPSHLGHDRQAQADAVWGRARQAEDKLWVYTGSTKTIPLTRNERLRHSALLNSSNCKLYFSNLRRHLKRLPGDQIVVWMNHPLQVWALDALPPRRLVCFDWTDDWLQYSTLPVQDRAEMERANDRMVREADVVFAVSESLRLRASVINRRTHLAPNATDFELLSRSADPALSEAIELLDIPRPRLGYIGQIGENIDYGMVRDLATSHPEWSFVFVGPIWATRQAEVDDLSALPNVHFVGGQPHRRLPNFVRGFDMCIMPHLDNALTVSMDPTKLYDYLASGKPIVSTRVAGTERFADVVIFGDTAHDLACGIRAALQENSAKAQARLGCARQNSWPQRGREIWAIINRYIARG